MKEFIDYRVWDAIIRIMYKDMNNNEHKNDKSSNSLSRKIQIGIYIDDARLDEYDNVKTIIKDAGFAGNPLSYRKDNIIWAIEELDEDAARVFEGAYWSVSDKKSMPTKAGRHVSDISDLGADIIRYINSHDSQKARSEVKQTVNNRKERKQEDNKMLPPKRDIHKREIADKIKCYMGDEIQYNAENMEKKCYSTNPSVVSVNDEKIVANGIGEAELIWGNNEKACQVVVKSNLSRLYYREIFVNVEVLFFLLGLWNYRNGIQCTIFSCVAVICGLISLIADKCNRTIASIFIIICTIMVYLHWNDLGVVIANLLK